ncbi:hypothetical protein BBJ28_00022537, partial [Nothophytophthora sp. Chile5]
ISDDHVQYFLYQMLVAIHYIHSAEVLHRDLKPSNILVNSDCDLKLCDFGLARGIQGMDSGLTEYVVTRWYRAPELLLSSKYDKQMDVWAIGCILAEMLGRRPLFPGHDYLHQLKIIMDVVGSPSEDSLDFITNPKAKRFILRQPKKPKVPLSSVYPRATPQCLDLLEKMLVFDPRKRITIADALAHPYLSLVRDRSVERTCPKPFDFAFENVDLTKQKLQELIFEDVCAFHPDAGVVDPVVVAAPPAVSSAPSRPYADSNTRIAPVSASSRTQAPASAPASVPAAASAVSSSVSIPPAPVSLVAPAALVTGPTEIPQVVEEPISSAPEQLSNQVRPSPVVLLPPGAVAESQAPAPEPASSVVVPVTTPPAPVSSAPAAPAPALVSMPTASIEPMEHTTPAVVEQSPQAEVAIEIVETPAHTSETVEEEEDDVEAALDEIGSIHNVSVAEATVEENDVTDLDAPNSTSTSSSEGDGEDDGESTGAKETEREIDLSTSPKKQLLQPNALLTPSSVV